jgi:drug/metabolite transporter (DMT)-like permease
VGAILILREHPPPIQIAGILFVCGGVIAIGFSHRASQGIHRGLAYAVATGITIGCYTLIDASGVRATINPMSYVLWFFVAHGLCVLVTAPGIRGSRVIVEARRQWKLGILVSILSMISYGAAMLAWRYGATAQLAALRETSVLFGTALAMQFLGETMTPRRWMAACGIVLGAILLQLK